jgi:mannosyl-oligosaccharide alpha-1,2-mannosidase
VLVVVLFAAVIGGFNLLRDYKPPAQRRGELYLASVDDGTHAPAIDDKPALSRKVLPDTYGNGKRHPHFPDGGPVPLELDVRVDDQTARQRSVAEMVRHAWAGYSTHAMGHDELRPLSRRFSDWGVDESVGDSRGGHGGIGVTAIEALGTLWLTGNHREFGDALAWLEQHHTFDVDVTVSVFEVTIRVLGGLLSAYELTGRHILLDKAVDLGTRLMHAFPASGVCDASAPHCRRAPGVIPSASINLRTLAASNAEWLGTTNFLAEATSVQLEFKKLSYHTGDMMFDDAAQDVMPRVLRNIAADGGLFPILVDRFTGASRAAVVTLGARGDSFYECLAKQAAFTRFTEERYVGAWAIVSQAIRDRIVVRLNATRSFIASLTPRVGRVRQSSDMEHLACFAPAMFLAGRAKLDGARATAADRDRFAAEGAVAEAVALTCADMYATASGMAPEIVQFRGGKMHAAHGAAMSVLRPEALEAFFHLLWEGDALPEAAAAWRERAWRVVFAVNSHARVLGGFAGIEDVERRASPYIDKMESFVLGETLKYAFLALAEGEPLLRRGDWVFTTEAHPLRVLPGPLRRSKQQPPPLHHGHAIHGRDVDG